MKSLQGLDSDAFMEKKLHKKISQMVVKDGDLLQVFLHPQQNQLQEIQDHHGGFGYLKILPLKPQFLGEFPYIGRTRFETEESWTLQALRPCISNPDHKGWMATGRKRRENQWGFAS